MKKILILLLLCSAPAFAQSDVSILRTEASASGKDISVTLVMEIANGTWNAGGAKVGVYSVHPNKWDAVKAAFPSLCKQADQGAEVEAQALDELYLRATGTWEPWPLEDPPTVPVKPNTVLGCFAFRQVNEATWHHFVYWGYINYAEKEKDQTKAASYDVDSVKMMAVNQWD